MSFVPVGNFNRFSFLGVDVSGHPGGIHRVLGLAVGQDIV